MTSRALARNRGPRGAVRLTPDELLELLGRARIAEKLAARVRRDLANEVKKHDLRAYLSSQAEVLARGVRDNLMSVNRNYERV